MPNRDWINGFAIGLTLGAAVILVLITVDDHAKDLAECVAGAKCDGYAAKYEGSELPDWWWWRWTGDLVSSSDTLAQWIMAILTIVAVGLLWRTLVQTNRTNEAAVSAATAAAEANEIMRAEQRPWVTLTPLNSCEFSDTSAGLNVVWFFSLANRGRTPAYNIGISWKPFRLDLFPTEDQIDAAVCEVLREAEERTEKRLGRITALFPGEDFGQRWAWLIRGQEPAVKGDGDHVWIVIGVCYKLDIKGQRLGKEALVFRVQNHRTFGPFAYRLRAYSFWRETE